MDPFTIILSSVVAPLVVKGVGMWMERKWGSQSSNKGVQQGISYDVRTGFNEMPNVGGTLSPARGYHPYAPPGFRARPINMWGEFFIGDSLEWLRGDEVPMVLIVESLADSGFGQVSLFLSSIDGYSVDLIPGYYYIYAFLLDPEASSILDAEIVAIGYPDLDSEDDPNPVELTGEGELKLDLMFFDRVDFPFAPENLAQL